ncbi:MAG TPA: DinB family protein [Pseudonocardiaceae bacterium]|nr:DinB family protein [Pseudonocardiaceae bacterium]
MADRKPPPLAADDRDTLMALLRFQRESLVRKVTGVAEEAARTRFVPSGTTLLWLVKHLSRAETVWVRQRFAGEDVALPDDDVTPADTLAGAVEEYRATWAATDALIASADLDTVARRADATVNLRWILAHLLEETARHAGHADIIRELLDGQTGR